VATILLAGVDPLVAERLSRLLAGHRLISTESVDRPDLVISDIDRVEPGEVSDAYPEIPILGYSSHTDPSHLRAAQKAGFDGVVERSLLLESAEALVSKLTLPLE
jgi:DNA-binding NarL/FixJ family response regulator